MKYIALGLFVIWPLYTWLSGGTGRDIGDTFMLAFLIFVFLLGTGGDTSREPWGGG